MIKVLCNKKEEKLLNINKIIEIKDKIKGWYSKSKIVSIIQSILIFLFKAVKYMVYQLFYHWKIGIFLLTIICLYYFNQNETLINKVFDFHILNYYIAKVITFYDFHKNLQISQYALEGAILLLIMLFLIFSFRLKDLKQNKIKKIKVLKEKGVELPYFTWRTRLWLNLKIAVWYWNMNGIDPKVFDSDEFKGSFQSAFNVTFIDKQPVKNSKNKIKLLVASRRYSLPKEISIDIKDINYFNSIFLLGENLLGKVKIDISKRPHLLIAGDTGSGKSVLIDSLIYQAMLKGYVIRACDPKQTEFNGWHNLTISNTNLLNNGIKNSQFSRTTDLRGTLENLNLIEKELKLRQSLFANEKCRNIDKYNKKLYSSKSSVPLSRIIYIFDEFVELITSKNKTIEEKSVIEEIERILKLIATRGRSLGIHLILSAQRPDCNLLDGQIKSNLSNRICGRMPDRSASETALGKGNYDACTLINEDELGKFVTNDGKCFKGYLLDTDTLTEELHKQYDKQDIFNLGGNNNVEQ